MIRNYLKIAWRNLRQDKVFTSLNLLGLSVAFGVVMRSSTGIVVIIALLIMNFQANKAATSDSVNSLKYEKA